MNVFYLKLHAYFISRVCVHTLQEPNTTLFLIGCLSQFHPHMEIYTYRVLQTSRQCKGPPVRLPAFQIQIFR